MSSHRKPESVPFGEGRFSMPTEFPQFRTPEWTQLLHSVIERNAPRRFAAIGHDATTGDSAVLAWGFDYGDGEVIVESAQDDSRWLLTAPENLERYLPPHPDGGFEIIWIDGKDGIANIPQPTI